MFQKLVVRRSTFSWTLPRQNLQKSSNLSCDCVKTAKVIKMPVQKCKVQLSVTRLNFGRCFYCDVRLNYRAPRTSFPTRLTKQLIDCDNSFANLYFACFVSKLCKGTGQQNTNKGVYTPTPWTNRWSLQRLWALPWRSTSAAEPLFVAVVLWPFPGAQRGSAPHGEPKHTQRNVLFSGLLVTRVYHLALWGAQQLLHWRYEVPSRRPRRSDRTIAYIFWKTAVISSVLLTDRSFSSRKSNRSFQLLVLRSDWRFFLLFFFRTNILRNSERAEGFSAQLHPVIVCVHS